MDGFSTKIKLHDGDVVTEINGRFHKPPMECLFCGATGEYGGLYVINSEVGYSAGKRQVWCDTCGARGPGADTDNQAIEKWNKGR